MKGRWPRGEAIKFWVIAAVLLGCAVANPVIGHGTGPTLICTLGFLGCMSLAISVRYDALFFARAASASRLLRRPIPAAALAQRAGYRDAPSPTLVVDGREHELRATRVVVTVGRDEWRGRRAPRADCFRVQLACRDVVYEVETFRDESSARASADELASRLGLPPPLPTLVPFYPFDLPDGGSSPLAEAIVGVVAPLGFLGASVFGAARAYLLVFVGAAWVTRWIYTRALRRRADEHARQLVAAVGAAVAGADLSNADTASGDG